MEDHVYPVEAEIYHSDLGLAHKKIKELQYEAKRQGLWALGHPKEVTRSFAFFGLTAPPGAAFSFLYFLFHWSRDYFILLV